MCLDVLGQNSAIGTSLGQTTCGTQASERFQFVPLANGNYHLVNQNSGLCVDIAGGSTADGAKIQQWTCGSGTNQQFKLNPLSNGYSEIIAIHSGSCIDVANASMNSGDPVSQWHCYGNTNQHWKLEVPIGSAAPVYSFYRGIRMNGSAVTIAGHSWDSSTAAANVTVTGGNTFQNQNVTLNPAVSDAVFASMIRSSVYGQNLSITIGALPAGQYKAYLYVWEDNATTTYSLAVQGTTVLSSYSSGSAGTWKKLGPYAVPVANGNLQMILTGGDANVSGIELYKAQ